LLFDFNLTQPLERKSHVFLPLRNNSLAYLFWSWLLRRNGRYTSELDASSFGPSRGMNDYDLQAASYSRSNVKPDKQYSILPTVLGMVENWEGLTAIDVGCGAGFFTLPIAERGARLVCGVDSSWAQIELAKRVSPYPSVNYVVTDVFTRHSSVPVDIVNVPFVLNYARTVPILRYFLELLYKSLKRGGKVLFVVDLPNGKCLRRFGATKKLLGMPKDETRIQIELFNENKKICTLYSVYFTPSTIERLLRQVGFRNVRWHAPIVSSEGICAMGPGFWNGYTADPELGYLSTEK